jgi:hypothetical protein
MLLESIARKTKKPAPNLRPGQVLSFIAIGRDAYFT